MFKNKILACTAIAAAAALSACSDSGETKDTGAQPTTVQGTGQHGGSTGDYKGGAPKGGLDTSQHSVYFDFDKSDIKPEGLSVVANWAQYLSANPTAKARLEGNTDERGTREYNVALGERRDNSVASALQSRGVSSSQITQVSYGKDHPVALGHDESAWAQNRRVDLNQQ